MDLLEEQIRLLKGAGWKEHAKDHKRAIEALRIVATWAAFQIENGVGLDPRHVLNICEEAIKPYKPTTKTK